ncbi:hypothetical protein PMAYCL1PPCAC_02527, partial [Pristionchus mayeri]
MDTVAVSTSDSNQDAHQYELSWNGANGKMNGMGDLENLKEDKHDERLMGVIKQEDSNEDKSTERQSVIENSLLDKPSDGTTLSVLHPVTNTPSFDYDPLASMFYNPSTAYPSAYTGYSYPLVGQFQPTNLFGNSAFPSSFARTDFEPRLSYSYDSAYTSYPSYLNPFNQEQQQQPLQPAQEEVQRECIRCGMTLNEALRLTRNRLCTDCIANTNTSSSLTAGGIPPIEMPSIQTFSSSSPSLPISSIQSKSSITPRTPVTAHTKKTPTNVIPHHSSSSSSS